MSDPLTPDDAEDPLVEKLAFGIELEEQTMQDVRTSFQLTWSDEYRFCMGKLGSDGRFRSRTMCEMVIAREARKAYHEAIEGTYTAWPSILDQLRGCVDDTP